MHLQVPFGSILGQPDIAVNTLANFTHEMFWSEPSVRILVCVSPATVLDIARNSSLARQSVHPASVFPDVARGSVGFLCFN